MNDENPARSLSGRKALVIGIANDQSIAYGCAKAFRELGADVAVTYLNDKARPYVEPLARELEAPLFLPLDVAVPGQLEAVFDAVTREVGPARHPRALDRVRAEGGSAGRPPQLLRRRLRQGDGRVVPFVRAHGPARGAAHEGRRHDVRDELLRRQQGRADLQRDGAGQGGAGGVLPLSRLRARRPGHPRARDLAGAAQDARRVGSQGLRHACSPRPRSARPSASSSTSWTSASPARTSRRRSRGACPARRCTWTAASTSWREPDGEGVATLTAHAVSCSACRGRSVKTSRGRA